jgi:hypothetical protein
LTAAFEVFSKPNHFEQSLEKREKNITDFPHLETSILEKSRQSTLVKRSLMGNLPEKKKIYDDELVRTISEEFSDRIRTVPIFGDIIRAAGMSMRRKNMSIDNFLNLSIDKVTSKSRISRFDIAQLTRILPLSGNDLLPFMNGGPSGEYWNKANDGFYDWIDNRSTESIFGIELGFKADDYGLEVSNKLINNKRKMPNINISILIDGFVSYLMTKNESSREAFENNTIDMVRRMRQEGINVYVNDSWNPLSSDFLAANHIKLWIFDEAIAFYGGIGIESQFRRTLYDEMDRVQGPIVGVMSIMALLLMANQKNELTTNESGQYGWITKDRLQQIFEKNKDITEGIIRMKISMNVPGYVQDAQHEYISLLRRPDVEEIYIMAPYFSDDKIARALIVTANRLRDKLIKKELPDDDIESTPRWNSTDHKKIHVIFPKKQENRLIEEVSRYYAYYLRNNPVVETRQFYAENSEKYEMLHAKQMVVVLHNKKRNWVKYVKFGGSYNPAGRAQNMWEMNAVAINGSWEESDEGPSAAIDNAIRDYLNNVMRVVVAKYSEPFPWGQTSVELSPLQKFFMRLSQLLWV